MNWFAIVWLALMVLFILLEAGTVSMVSIWFAAGSLTALIASLFGAELWLQIVLFAVISAALLLALRPLARKYFTPRLTKTNVDAVVGTEGLVTERIDNISSVGRVKLDHMEWSARSTSGESVEVGTRIRVDRVEGVKVFVTPLEVPVQ